MQFQLENYAGKVRALGVVWLIYAGFALITGIVGMAFAKAFLSGRFGPWMDSPFMRGPMPPEWILPLALHFAWLAIVVRVALAIAAGWGLMEHARWGRILAIVVAFLSLLKFPFGTVLGIWTLVVLMGYRNSTLYNQL